MNIFEEMLAAINKSRMETCRRMVRVDLWTRAHTYQFKDFDQAIIVERARGISAEKVERFLERHGLYRPHMFEYLEEDRCPVGVFHDPTNFRMIYRGRKRGRHWAIAIPG